MPRIRKWLGKISAARPRHKERHRPTGFGFVLADRIDDVDGAVQRAMTADTRVEHALFSSAIGEIGIAWSDAGLVALQLPDVDARATERRLAALACSRTSASPPAWVHRAIARIASLVAGAPDDLADLRLDLSRVPPFHARVYAALRTVGPGNTISYGGLARRVGAPAAARAVGQAMRRNPLPIVVPCHRVLAAHGRPGGFSAPGGLATKESLLRAEGVSLTRDMPSSRDDRRTRVSSNVSRA